MTTRDTTNLRTSSNEFFLPENRLYIAVRGWLRWLQGLFSARPVSNLKWHPNDTESEILIYDHNPTSTQKTNKRPFITTTLTAASMAGTSRDQLLEHSLVNPDKKYSDIMTTAVNITCVAREGIEAGEIAYTILRMIPVFKPTIQKISRIHWIGQGIQLLPETNHGEIVQGSSYPEWRAVPLVVPFAIQDVISADRKLYNTMKTVNQFLGIE